MKVSFIGSPGSGKTTTASSIFTRFKEMSINTEMIMEQARTYISAKRFRLKILDDTPIVLDDSDQVHIMYNQLMTETITQYGIGNRNIILTDSSPLNSLWYMSDATRQLPQVADIITKTIESTDMFFFSHPTIYNELDFNRIHSKEQSRQIHEDIPLILETYAPTVLSKLIPLAGDINVRHGDALSAILKFRMGLYQ